MSTKKNCSLADIKDKLQRGEKLTTLEEIFYLLNLNQKVAAKNTSVSVKLSPSVSPQEQN